MMWISTVFVLELVPDLCLELACDLEVVEFLAGPRVDLHQLGRHHGRREIVRHESSHDPCLEDILADEDQPLRGRPELRRDHVAAGEASLDDLGEANVGREDGLDGAPVHARQEEDLVGDVLDHLEELGREDVPLLVAGGDQEAIGTTELLSVLQERLHVRMLEWQELLEPGVDLDLGHLVAHDEGDQTEYQEHQSPVSENTPFDCGKNFFPHGFPPKIP